MNRKKKNNAILFLSTGISAMAKTCMLLWGQSKKTKIIQGKDLDFIASIPAYSLTMFTCDTYGIGRCSHMC